MANYLSNNAANLFFSINNQWTSVLLEQLMINGSRLAQTDWEKQFMICLGCHDQEFLGLGVVGMDITDFEWDAEHLEQQKAFAIQIAESALSEADCALLGYEPGFPKREFVDRFLAEWRQVIGSIQAEHIPADSAFYWPADAPTDLDRLCPKHKVYLHNLHEDDSKCCVICNQFG